MKLSQKLQEIWESPNGILLAFAPIFTVGIVAALITLYLIVFGQS